MMYVVAEANNIDFNVNVSDIFTSKKDARKHLSAMYKDYVDTLCDHIAEKNKTADAFTISTFGDDYYYGHIREVKMAPGTGGFGKCRIEFA